MAQNKEINFTSRDYRTLSRLWIDTADFDLSNIKIQRDFQTLIKTHRKSILNSGLAIGLTSLSAIYIVVGGILATAGDNIIGTTGIATLAQGAIFGIVSIPFWIGKRKQNILRQKQLNQLYSY